MPKGVKKLGYKLYEKNNSNNPLCYNCETSEWSPNTHLGKCCTDQENRSNYPQLSSPDYAYLNDYNDRLNHNITKNCKVRQKDQKLIC